MANNIASGIADQLRCAGLKLSITASGDLGVVPRRCLTSSLRDLIRQNKSLLIELLCAEKSVVNHTLDSAEANKDQLQFAGSHISLASTGTLPTTDHTTSTSTSPAFFEKSQDNPVEIGTVRPLGLSPFFLAASLALDRQILASDAELAASQIR